MLRIYNCAKNGSGLIFVNSAVLPAEIHVRKRFLKTHGEPMFSSRNQLFVISGLFAAVSAFDANETYGEAPSPNLPAGAHEILVKTPNAVSGVAHVEGNNYVVVGDKTPDAYSTIVPPAVPPTAPPTPTALENKFEDKSLGNELNKVCDAEDIDVGIKDKASPPKLFVLSEDDRTIYIEGGNPIHLPPQFSELCGRGTEGISVRWDDGHWALLVVSEGGIPSKTHDLHEFKKSNCARARVPCPLAAEIHNPWLARYSVSADGKSSILESLKPLQIPHPPPASQGFRASDITWFDQKALVLLVSGPISQDEGAGPFAHARLQGFKLDGSPDPNMTMNLDEGEWAKYRELRVKDGNVIQKNWEGLDEVSGTGKLVMSHDDEKPSNLVVFKPVFDKDKPAPTGP